MGDASPDHDPYHLDQYSPTNHDGAEIVEFPVGVPVSSLWCVRSDNRLFAKSSAGTHGFVHIVADDEKRTVVESVVTGASDERHYEIACVLYDCLSRMGSFKVLYATGNLDAAMVDGYLYHGTRNWRVFADYKEPSTVVVDAVPDEVACASTFPAFYSAAREADCENDVYVYYYLNSARNRLRPCAKGSHHIELDVLPGLLIRPPLMPFGGIRAHLRGLKVPALVLAWALLGFKHNSSAKSRLPRVLWDVHVCLTGVVDMNDKFRAVREFIDKVVTGHAEDACVALVRCGAKTTPPVSSVEELVGALKEMQITVDKQVSDADKSEAVSTIIALDIVSRSGATATKPPRLPWFPDCLDVPFGAFLLLRCDAYQAEVNGVTKPAAKRRGSRAPVAPTPRFALSGMTWAAKAMVKARIKQDFSNEELSSVSALKAAYGTSTEVQSLVNLTTEKDYEELFRFLNESNDVPQMVGVDKAKWVDLEPGGRPKYIVSADHSLVNSFPKCPELDAFGAYTFLGVSSAVSHAFDSSTVTEQDYDEFALERNPEGAFVGLLCFSNLRVGATGDARTTDMTFVARPRDSTDASNDELASYVTLRTELVGGVVTSYGLRVRLAPLAESPNEERCVVVCMGRVTNRDNIARPRFIGTLAPVEAHEIARLLKRALCCAPPTDDFVGDAWFLLSWSYSMFGRIAVGTASPKWQGSKLANDAVVHDSHGPVAADKDGKLQLSRRALDTYARLGVGGIHEGKIGMNTRDYANAMLGVTSASAAAGKLGMIIAFVADWSLTELGNTARDKTEYFAAACERESWEVAVVWPTCVAFHTGRCRAAWSTRGAKKRRPVSSKPADVLANSRDSFVHTTIGNATRGANLDVPKGGGIMTTSISPDYYKWYLDRAKRGAVSFAESTPTLTNVFETTLVAVRDKKKAVLTFKNDDDEYCTCVLDFTGVDVEVPTAIKGFVDFVVASLDVKPKQRINVTEDKKWAPAWRDVSVQLAHIRTIVTGQGLIDNNSSLQDLYAANMQDVMTGLSGHASDVAHDSLDDPSLVKERYNHLVQAAAGEIVTCAMTMDVCMGLFNDAPKFAVSVWHRVLDHDHRRRCGLYGSWGTGPFKGGGKISEMGKKLLNAGLTVDTTKKLSATFQARRAASKDADKSPNASVVDVMLMDLIRSASIESKELAVANNRVATNLTVDNFTKKLVDVLGVLPNITGIELARVVCAHAYVLNRSADEVLAKEAKVIFKKAWRATFNAAFVDDSAVNDALMEHGELKKQNCLSHPFRFSDPVWFVFRATVFSHIDLFYSTQQHPMDESDVAKILWQGVVEDFNAANPKYAVRPDVKTVQTVFKDVYNIVCKERDSLSGNAWVMAHKHGVGLQKMQYLLSLSARKQPVFRWLAAFQEGGVEQLDDYLTEVKTAREGSNGVLKINPRPWITLISGFPNKDVPESVLTGEKLNRHERLVAKTREHVLHTYKKYKKYKSVNVSLTKVTDAMKEGTSLVVALNDLPLSDIARVVIGVKEGQETLVSWVLIGTEIKGDLRGEENGEPKAGRYEVMRNMCRELVDGDSAVDAEVIEQFNKADESTPAQEMFVLWALHLGLVMRWSCGDAQKNKEEQALLRQTRMFRHVCDVSQMNDVVAFAFFARVIETREKTEGFDSVALGRHVCRHLLQLHSDPLRVTPIRDILNDELAGPQTRVLMAEIEAKTAAINDYLFRSTSHRAATTTNPVKKLKRREVKFPASEFVGVLVDKGNLARVQRINAKGNPSDWFSKYFVFETEAEMTEFDLAMRTAKVDIADAYDRAAECRRAPEEHGEHDSFYTLLKQARLNKRWAEGINDVIFKELIDERLVDPKNAPEFWIGKKNAKALGAWREGDDCLLCLELRKPKPSVTVLKYLLNPNAMNACEDRLKGLEEHVTRFFAEMKIKTKHLNTGVDADAMFTIIERLCEMVVRAGDNSNVIKVLWDRVRDMDYSNRSLANKSFRPRLKACIEEDGQVWVGAPWTITNAAVAVEAAFETVSEARTRYKYEVGEGVRMVEGGGVGEFVKVSRSNATGVMIVTTQGSFAWSVVCPFTLRFAPLVAEVTDPEAGAKCDNLDDAFVKSLRVEACDVCGKEGFLYEDEDPFWRRVRDKMTASATISQNLRKKWTNHTFTYKNLFSTCVKPTTWEGRLSRERFDRLTLEDKQQRSRAELSKMIGAKRAAMFVCVRAMTECSSFEDHVRRQQLNIGHSVELWADYLCKVEGGALE